MKVSALVSKNRRIQVFLDGEYAFSCSESFVIDNQLFAGKEIDFDDANGLKKQAAESILKAKLFEYALSGNYSEKELYRKVSLYAKKRYSIEIPKDLFDKQIKEIKAARVYNEASSLSNLANLYKGRSKGQNYIYSKLMQKGFSKESIKEELAGQDEDGFKQKLVEFLNTKKESLEKKISDKYKLKQKLIQSALARGYNYSDVKSALE